MPASKIMSIERIDDEIRRLQERRRIELDREAAREELLAFLKKRPLINRALLRSIIEDMPPDSVPGRNATPEQIEKFKVQAPAKAQGDVIAQRMRRKNITDPFVLAKQIGVSHAAVYGWMSGTFWPGYDKCEKLAKILGGKVEDYANPKTAALVAQGKMGMATRRNPGRPSKFVPGKPDKHASPRSGVGGKRRAASIDWDAIRQRHADGENYRALARELGVSDKTVRDYVLKAQSASSGQAEQAKAAVEKSTSEVS